jgi:hypothetical protein
MLIDIWREKFIACNLMSCKIGDLLFTSFRLLTDEPTAISWHDKFIYIEHYYLDVAQHLANVRNLLPEM